MMKVEEVEEEKEKGDMFWGFAGTCGQIRVGSWLSTGKRGKTSFVLIGCEMSEKYRVYKKDLVRTVTSTRKCGFPFKL